MPLETHQLPDEVAVISFSGDLSTESLKQFKEEVRSRMPDDIHTIVVDCRELGTISSGGLAALLWARAKVSRRGGKIYLTHVSSVVSDVLAVTKLSTIISIVPTTREALVSDCCQVIGKKRRAAGVATLRIPKLGILNTCDTSCAAVS